MVREHHDKLYSYYSMPRCLATSDPGQMAHRSYFIPLPQRFRQITNQRFILDIVKVQVSLADHNTLRRHPTDPTLLHQLLKQIVDFLAVESRGQVGSQVMLHTMSQKGQIPEPRDSPH